MRKKIIYGCFLVCISYVIFLSSCTSEDILKQIPELAAVVAKEENQESQPERSPEVAVATATPLNRAESFLDEKSSTYYYEQLSDAEKIWYDDMKQIIGTMSPAGKLSKQGIRLGLKEESIDKIFQCFMNDHPEVFYVDGYSYTKYSLDGELVSVDFVGKYQMDMETAGKRKEEIEKSIGNILSGVSKSLSDYEKIKYIYETIILHTDYDLNAEDNQNIYSVFVNSSSVCQGYAKAVQMLLNRLDVFCTLARGTVYTGEGHAWNLVMADGCYYYVDVTWGDAHYTNLKEHEQKESFPEINYDYLCIPTEQLLRTHALETTVPMPECVAIQDNYFVRENAYFEEYNKAQLKDFFRLAEETGQKNIYLKCSDWDCYQKIYEDLITDSEILKYYRTKERKMSYSSNDKCLSMTFWVTNE